MREKDKGRGSKTEREIGWKNTERDGRDRGRRTPKMGWRVERVVDRSTYFQRKTIRDESNAVKRNSLPIQMSE